MGQTKTLEYYLDERNIQSYLNKKGFDADLRFAYGIQRKVIQNTGNEHWLSWKLKLFFTYSVLKDALDEYFGDITGNDILKLLTTYSDQRVAKIFNSIQQLMSTTTLKSGTKLGCVLNIIDNNCEITADFCFSVDLEKNQSNLCISHISDVKSYVGSIINVIKSSFGGSSAKYQSLNYPSDFTIYCWADFKQNFIRAILKFMIINYGTHIVCVTAGL